MALAEYWGLGVVAAGCAGLLWFYCTDFLAGGLTGRLWFGRGQKKCRYRYLGNLRWFRLSWGRMLDASASATVYTH